MKKNSYYNDIIHSTMMNLGENETMINELKHV